MVRRDYLASESLESGGMVLAGSDVTWPVQAVIAAAASGVPWKSVVVANLQWPGSRSTANPVSKPTSCAVDIIDKLNDQPHKNLIGQNDRDGLFGSTVIGHATSRDTFATTTTRRTQ